MESLYKYNRTGHAFSSFYSVNLKDHTDDIAAGFLSPISG